MGDRIYNLATTSTPLTASDKVPYAPASQQGSTFATTIGDIAAFVSANAGSGSLSTMRLSPLGSSWDQSLADETANVWLIIDKASATSGSLALPANPFDGQSVVLTTRGQIEFDILSGSGREIVLGILAFDDDVAAGSSIEFRYSALAGAWFLTALSLSGYSTLQISTAIVDEADATIVGFTSVADAVNHLMIANAETGDPVVLFPEGGDTDVALTVRSTGAAQLLLQSPAGTVVINSPTAAVNITASTAINLSGAVSGDATWTNSASVVAAGFRSVGSTVAGLPAAAAGNRGERRHVTDSNATLTAGIGAVVAGGGANIVPVFSDGTNWRIG